MKLFKQCTIIFILLFLSNSNIFLANANSLKVINNNSRSEQSYIKFTFDSLLQNRALSSTKFSLAVVSLDDNDVIYQKNGDEFVKPASVTKLITSFSTLSTVGDNFKLNTNIYTNDRTVSGSEINGNLYIKGIGDCLFSLSDLDEIVRQISNLGIKKITGNIIADGNFFDEENNRFKYSGDNDEVEPVAVITALAIERNMIKIFINTNVNSNEPKIQVIPNADNIIVKSNIKFQNTSKKSKKKLTKLSANSKIDSNGNQIIYLNGILSKNSSYSIQEFNLSPELTIASLLKKRLESSGIVVTGKYTKQLRNSMIDYSKLSQIASISRPILDLITNMNKNSDNFIAENLYKFNGAISQKDSNLSKSSRLLIDSLIKPFNQFNQKVQIYDGSGLSRRNRVNALIMVNLLKQATTKPFFQSFSNSLAIGGVDGTIAKRFKNTSAEQSVFAKTGTHKDVSALAGFARNLDGKIYVFAFFFNGPNVGIYKEIEKKAVEILTGFSKNSLNN